MDLTDGLVLINAFEAVFAYSYVSLNNLVFVRISGQEKNYV